MAEVLFSPQWFYGVDAIFESIAIIATLLLSFYSFKLYTFTRKSSHKYFSLSFFLLFLSFVAKVTTNLLLYFPALREATAGFILNRYFILQKTNFVYGVGNIAFRFLMLLGLLGIFWIIGKSREKNKILILIYFVSLAAFTSIFSVSIIAYIVPLYPLFHITAALFLAYITYFYYSNYLVKKKKATFYIFLSFLLLCLSQLAFIFIIFNLKIYVIAELLQLAGYFLLLYEYYIFSGKR